MDHTDKIATGNYLNTIQRVFIKRWWLIILITFFVSVSAFVASKMVEPVYEASTSIRVQSPAQSRLTFGKISLEPEAMWLKSRYLLELVMKNLGIGNSNNQGEYIETMEKLQKNINVKTFEGANTLMLIVRWNDAEMVAKITNTLADTFIEKYQIFNSALTKEKRSFIEEQLNLTRIKLDEAQKSLTDFQEKEGIISLDDEIRGVTNRISSWEARQYQIDMDIKLAQARVNQIKEQMPQIQGSNVQDFQANIFRDNTALSSMQDRISRLEAEIASMSYKFTDEYSPLLLKRKELEEIKNKFQNELSKTASTSENKSYGSPVNKDFIVDLVKTQMDIDAKQNEQILLADLLKIEREKIKVLPEKQIRYIDILREEKVSEEHYTGLLKRLAEARIEENVDMWDIRVFDRAYQPYQPLEPRPIRNTIFGAIIGFVLGVGLSMIFEYFDDSFHSVNEVEEFLGLPVLAAIPKMEK